MYKPSSRQKRMEVEVAMQLDILDANFDKQTHSLKSDDIKTTIYSYDVDALLNSYHALKDRFTIEVHLVNEVVREHNLKTGKELKTPIKEWCMYVTVDYKGKMHVQHNSYKTFKTKKEALGLLESKNVPLS